MRPQPHTGSRESRESGRGAASSPRRAAVRALAVAGLAVLFGGVAVWLVEPALEGEFLSDDYLYIVNNRYVHELSWDNLRALLDPWGQPTAYTLNYAPVHLLLHAAEYEVFGEQDMVGWHVVNAVAHGLTALVLVAFFRRASLPTGAALFGGAVFLVHPANLETVAWIFQLKTIVALALALGALLLHERRPALGTLLFALSLLTKISSLFALPVAVVQAWVRSRRGAPPRWGWLAVWGGVALAVGVLEMRAFQIQADPRLEVHEDLGVHARTVVAIAMRYLAMAYTGGGVSTFHEPPPAVSWADPWWLGGLAALGLLGGRTAVTLWRREEESAFWVLALASFAPVSQVFPFIFPVGDRYLYPILPGLLGGALLAGHAPAARLLEAAGDRAELLRRAAAVAAVALVVVLAVRTRERAPVFRTNRAMMVEAALNYPEGMQAHLLRGHRAAAAGDARAAGRAFGRAVELGFSDLHALLVHPGLAPVRDHPAFRAVLRDLASRDVARIASREAPGQSELMSLGLAHEVRGERREAIRAYERALEAGGAFDEDIRARLQRLRRQGDGRR